MAIAGCRLRDTGNEERSDCIKRGRGEGDGEKFLKRKRENEIEKKNKTETGKETFCHSQVVHKKKYFQSDSRLEHCNAKQ